jgi:hypothetical protein
MYALITCFCSNERNTLQTIYGVTKLEYIFFSLPNYFSNMGALLDCQSRMGGRQTESKKWFIFLFNLLTIPEIYYLKVKCRPPN